MRDRPVSYALTSRPVPEIVLASFNAHAGVRPRPLREGHWLRQVGSRTAGIPWRRSRANGEGVEPPPSYDLAGTVAELDADIIVVQEAFRPDEGFSALDDAAEKLGYELREVMFGRVTLAPWPHICAEGDGCGQVGLTILSRFPIHSSVEVPVRPVRFDPAPSRRALRLEVDVEGQPLDVVGLHLTSRLPHGPALQLRHLRPRLPHVGRPAVIAGDFNFWGPPVVGMLEGWRRAVRGRTWPAERPRNQIDHVLVRPTVEVLEGEVLDDVGSDHRPIRARLRIP